MRVLIINSVCGIRSTGRICTDLAKDYMSEGHEVRIAYGRESVPKEYSSIAVRIGNSAENYINALKSRLLDNEGFNAVRATKIFLNWAEGYNPDVLWLHNLHGYYINIDLLFRWIKARPAMQVKWLLHDCWAFTGHCSHFSYVECGKWKKLCHECPQKYEYPASLFRDNCKANYLQKKRAFCGVTNMTIVTPSYWLADLVKQSFLNGYPIDVVYNRINTDIFKPTANSFREKIGIANKKLVLGVASAWCERKGLDDFYELDCLLDSSFQIVLVGLTKKQLRKIPSTIIGIQRTNNIKELAEIYTAADVFVNPSKEETFGLTTIEALACGTPAVVYQDTACEEIARMFGGVVVERSVQSIKSAVEQLCSMKYLASKNKRI